MSDTENNMTIEWQTDEYPHIAQFVKDTGFTCYIGQIGFGRPCVGILEPKDGCCVAYEITNDNYEMVSLHTVASDQKAPNAYHKNPNLAVLYGDSRSATIETALKELDDWVARIMTAGYKVINYDEGRHSMSAFLGHSTMRKGIVDKEGNNG